jgi:hypothetical protein
MSKWNQDYKVDSYNIHNIEKFLFYSDGIVENSTADGETPYSKFIENDFKNSFTREEFKDKFYTHVREQEDDLTLIFINSLDMCKETLLNKKIFASSLDAVDSATQWYEDMWQAIDVDVKISYKAAVVFTELFMNAYEHGSLGLDSKTKHKYLEDDIYFEKLIELEENCTKEISVEIYKVKELESEYVITKICDEGDGFDTQILSQIFRNSKKFNGRGVFVSRRNSMGIYYNSKGNCVLFLNKI